MLIQSQPLDPKFFEKMGLNKDDGETGFSDKEIKEQFIGGMLDHFLGGIKNVPSLIIVWYDNKSLSLPLDSNYTYVYVYNQSIFNLTN